MDRRGGEPREAPRTRLFITLDRRRFGLNGGERYISTKEETRVARLRTFRPSREMDARRFSSRDDAPAAETNTPEVGRPEASTIRLSQVAGSRVPKGQPYERRTG